MLGLRILVEVVTQLEQTLIPMKILVIDCGTCIMSRKTEREQFGLACSGLAHLSICYELGFST